MGWHFISNIWHTGLNISKWWNPQLGKLWVTVSDSFLISLMNILVSCCFSLVKIIILFSHESSPVIPLHSGKQRWHSGDSTRLPPMWPGFESWHWRHMWVEFVVGSCLCSKRFFSGCFGFPLTSKPTFLDSNLTRIQVDEKPPSGSATSKLLYIH